MPARTGDAHRPPPPQGHSEKHSARRRGRKLDRERRAVTRAVAVGDEGAAVVRNDRARDGQAESAAAVGHDAGRVDATEPFEDGVELIPRYPLTVVAEREADPASDRRGAELDVPSGGGVPERVCLLYTS